MLANIQRKTFTANEYNQMTEAGILGEDDHLELIKGEIICMAAIGSNHAACVNKLNHLFGGMLANTEVIISVQNPVAIGGHSEPEPDITILKPRDDFYASEHPKPKDVLLIIEVADTSLEYDRNVKLPLYAKAGIGEVWIVNLNDTCIEVRKEPAASEYKQFKSYRKGDILKPAAFSDMEIEADDILISVFDKKLHGII